MACACCQPPPGGCVCEDTCSYFIELVSPLAVKHGPYPCQVAVSSEVVTDSLIEGLIPYALSGKQEFPGINNASVAISSNTGSLLSVEVVHASHGFIDGTIFGSNRFSGGSTAAATVACNVGANGVRRYYANLGCSAHGEIYAVSGGEATTTGYWEKTYFGQFEIPATCISAPNRSCVNLSAETLHITTPLEITFSGNGTSSLGSLTLTSDSGYGVHSAGAQSAVESILGGLSYTVRIT